MKLTAAASSAGPNGMLLFAYQDPTHYRWVKISRSDVRIGQTGDFGGVARGTKEMVLRSHPIGRFILLTVKIYPDGWVRVFEGSGTGTRAVGAYRFLSGECRAS